MTDRMQDRLNAAQAYRASERRRVREMLARDKAERSREEVRKMAELQVREGVFVNLADTVVQPTEEWMAKGDTETFLPKQPKGTVRTVRSVRRVLTPAVSRMWRSGKIEAEHLKACLWYRYMHERAGLEGRFSSSRPSAETQAPKAQRQGGTGGHIPVTLEEAAARRAFRNARASLPNAYLRFFEAVVLDDIPIYRSWRLARCSRPKAVRRFRRIATELVDFCTANDFDLNVLER